MKIGSPKNLEGKNLLVGVSAVDGNGNAIGSDITTLKNGANVTFTSSANGVLVIDAESVTSVENATSAVYATNDKNGNDIATTYQTVINDGNKLNGAYVSGAVASATSAVSAGSLTNAITINGVELNGGTIKTLADLNIASKTHTHAIDDVTGLSSSISKLENHVADATMCLQPLARPDRCSPKPPLEQSGQTQQVVAPLGTGNMCAMLLRRKNTRPSAPLPPPLPPRVSFHLWRWTTSS